MKNKTLYRISHLCMLLNFITLVVTGVMRFFLPFNIGVTRVHMLCGFAVTLLIGFHIIGRIRQMKTMVKSRSGVNYAPVIFSVVLCAVYWSAAWYAWPGAKQVVDLSYESQRRKEIFRASEDVASRSEPSSLHSIKLTSERASLAVDLSWTKLGAKANTDVAVWVETKSGSMIETFFLSGGLRYSDKLSSREGEPRRGDILPVWRSRYTSICGIDPNGDIDAMSGPTKNHKFDLNNNFESNEAFSVFVEINDTTDGQPSVIYAGLVEPDSANAYTLLTLLGTGKDAKQSGAIHYDLSELTTAHKLIDKILVHTIWKNE